VGTLRVRFAADVQAHEQARILAALRKLKATVRHGPQDADPSAWVFDTHPLQTWAIDQHTDTQRDLGPR
jgi:hypothetical protein